MKINPIGNLVKTKPIQSQYKANQSQYKPNQTQPVVSLPALSLPALSLVEVSNQSKGSNLFQKAGFRRFTNQSLLSVYRGFCRAIRPFAESSLENPGRRDCRKSRLQPPAVSPQLSSSQSSNRAGNLAHFY